MSRYRGTPPLALLLALCFTLLGFGVDASSEPLGLGKLLAVYSFDGTADDVSGREKHGQINNDDDDDDDDGDDDGGISVESAGDCRVGGCYKFGDGGRIETPQIGRNYAAFTFAVWMRVDGLKKNDLAVLWNAARFDETGRVRFRLLYNALQFSLKNANAGDDVSALVTFPDNDTWTHVVWTYDETTGVKAFLDGHPVATMCGGNNVGCVGFGGRKAKLDEGRIGLRNGNQFLGSLDEMYFIEGAVSAREVKAIMEDRFGGISSDCATARQNGLTCPARHSWRGGGVDRSRCNGDACTTDACCVPNETCAGLYLMPEAKRRHPQCPARSITAAQTTDPTCKTGLRALADTRGPDCIEVCCPATCNQCGGPGCNAGNGCCIGSICGNGKYDKGYCDETMPPCRMRSSPTVCSGTMCHNGECCDGERTSTYCAVNESAGTSSGGITSPWRGGQKFVFNCAGEGMDAKPNMDTIECATAGCDATTCCAGGGGGGDGGGGGGGGGGTGNTDNSSSGGGGVGPSNTESSSPVAAIVGGVFAVLFLLVIAFGLAHRMRSGQTQTGGEKFKATVDRVSRQIDLSIPSAPTQPTSTARRDSSVISDDDDSDISVCSLDLEMISDKPKAPETVPDRPGLNIAAKGPAHRV
jgi:hypothetical protein